jgi:hypothetical protein
LSAKLSNELMQARNELLRRFQMLAGACFINPLEGKLGRDAFAFCNGYGRNQPELSLESEKTVDHFVTVRMTCEHRVPGATD